MRVIKRSKNRWRSIARMWNCAVGCVLLSGATTFAQQATDDDDPKGADDAPVAKAENKDGETAPQTQWKTGDEVEVEWKGIWYKAAIVEVEAERYKIHYDGYGANWDEWVTPNRVIARGAQRPAKAESGAAKKPRKSPM